MIKNGSRCISGFRCSLSKKPWGFGGAEASIGFGDMCGKSAKALRSKGFFSWIPGRAAGTREPCKPSKKWNNATFSTT